MAQLLSSQNGRAWLATGALCVGWLGVCRVAGKALPPTLSRKLVHIGTGPLFMLCWPAYSAAPASRWLAASVPAAAGALFAAVGAGLLHSDALVAGISRTGRRQELLRGPFYYGIAHVAVTLLLWRHSPAAVLALSALCGGDGLAEVVGRAAGPAAARLPHNRAKTVAGSLACWAGGAAMALPLLLHFRRLGLFDAAALHGWPLLAGVLACTGVGAAVESLPLPGELDNFAVTAAVAAAARCWWTLL